MEICVSTFICNKEKVLDVLPVFADNAIKNLELWGAFNFGSKHHFPYREHGYENHLIDKLKKFNIKVRTMHAPFSETLDISSLNDNLRKKAINEIKAAVSVFSRLPGAETVIVHPGGILTRPEEEKMRLAQSRKSLVELDRILSENKIRLAVENMLPGLVGWQPSALSLLIEGLSNTGICLDTGHAHISGVLDVILKTLKDEIIAFHLSDTYDSADRHLIPSEGTVNWSDFRKKALEGKKLAFLTFETRDRDNLTKALQEIKTAFRKLTLS
ncbi:MAG: sugar phosphate isomerase/epimerase family protein [Candidatus Ratteibacteria bacterium]|jgi:sugar phosphate isomerase/epimerase